MPAVSPSDGPVVVTGASGYVGSHVVIALLKRGYDVRCCVTDPENPAKVDHLKALPAQYGGSVTLYQANLLEDGAYDEAIDGAVGVLHAATAMGYGAANKPQQVYDGAVDGTRNVLASINKAGTVKRLVYTSSFAAIGNPRPSGYRFTEADWASDNRENDTNWSLENLNDKGETGYEMAKVECEKIVYAAAEADGGYEAVSINPIVVLGPLLSTAHELVYSWQWALGRMLGGKVNGRGWQHLWNIVDVRDVGEAQALALESDKVTTGDRFQLSATDASGEIDIPTIRTHLESLFPNYKIGSGPKEMEAMIEKYGAVYQAPLAHCDKARSVLGLKTHNVIDTLKDCSQTLIDLGLVQPELK